MLPADFTSLAGQSNGIASLSEQLAKQMGYDYYAVTYSYLGHHTPLQSVQHLPAGWDNIGNNDLRKRDPVSRLLMHNPGQIVIWNRDTYEQTDTIDLHDHFTSYGMRSGLDIPVISRDSQTIVVSLLRDGPLPIGDELIDHTIHLRLFGHRLAGSAIPLFQAQEIFDKLDIKQKNMVRLLVEGLSIDDIAKKTHLQSKTIAQRLSAIAKQAGLPSIDALAASQAKILR